jgi:hypothetical protein
MKNKKRYDNLTSDVNILKSLFNEMKNNISLIDLNLTKDYFCEKLCKLYPLIQSLKSFKVYPLDEAMAVYDKFLKNLTEITEIYQLKEFPQLHKSLVAFNSQNPSILLRCLLEANLFPNNTTMLFDKIDFQSSIINTLNDFKIDFLTEGNELISNYLNLTKETLMKNLRNKPRQLRESKQLFEALSILVMEGNQAEKNLKKKKKSCLTNNFLKNYLNEMLNYVSISFELELYSYFELDFIFYALHNILAFLQKNNEIIALNFADNIIRQDNFIKSPLKVALSNTQKMILDEVVLYDGLKNAVKGMGIICRYLKLNELIKNPQSNELEQKRIDDRVSAFKNHKYFIDLSYETFTNEMHFSKEEGEQFLASADVFFKQGLKGLAELKSADLNIRAGNIYSNEYVDNLCKVIISNNLLINKIKKITQPVRLSYNTTKYKSFLPLLEIN